MPYHYISVSKHMIYILAGQPSLAHLNIERFLHLNRSELMKHKFIYPLNGYRGWNHQNLYWELIQSTKFKECYGTLNTLESAIKKQKEEDPANNFILSLPALSKSYHGLISKTISRFKPYDDVTLVVILNHQLKYLYPFWYLERLAGSAKIDFGKWIRWRLSCNALGVDYYKGYEKISSIKGVDHLQYLHADQLEITGTLIDKFCSTIGITSDAKENLLLINKSVESVFPRPDFEKDLITFSEDLFGQSNTQIANIFESLSQLNSRDYL